VLGALGRTVIGLAIMPIVAATNVVLYYELRARNEGFDLERRVTIMAPDR
jgi:hypothetical protein